MKILFATSEAAPYYKSGGLGDVAQALPAELARNPQNEVCVFMPYYDAIKKRGFSEITFVKSFYVHLSWRIQHVGLFKAESADGRLTYYFIDNEYYFAREGSYGYNDDGERFAYFSKAVLETLAQISWYPDCIHCNDWQTALIPVFLEAHYRHLPEYSAIPVLFTIHNIEYQGKAPLHFIGDVLGLSGNWISVLENDGCANLMKAGIVMSDRVSTVSETYAVELSYPEVSRELYSILQRYGCKLCGITNGIDVDTFNPSTDLALPARFNADDPAGKAACKEALQREMGLEVREDAAVVSIVSRLVGHKGVELVADVIEEMLAENIQLVILGTGEPKYEALFRHYAAQRPGQVAARIEFNAALANRIYAGSDIFLMPSRNEPCGLSQMIAMRYGTVPLVRRTGGLADTVPAYDPTDGSGLGFTFYDYHPLAMLDGLRRALALREDRDAWATLSRNCMKADNSWQRSGEAYMQLYRDIIRCRESYNG